MSARSNEDRLGVDPTLMGAQEPPPPIPATENSPPQLNFVVPTEFIELPSRGEFYPPNHPLHNQKNIEIRHMTAKDEDILTSPTLLKQGVALDRMLQNIIVDSSIKVKELTIGDKNALLVAARLHGYGAQYLTAVNCPSCGSKQDYTFDLNALEMYNSFEEEMANYDVTRTANNTFLLPLPKTEYTVELKLLTGHDEEKMNKRAKKRKKFNFMETNTTDQLKAIILSVNGVTDTSTIGQFIQTLPAIDSRYIRKIYQKVTPTINLSHDYTCSECGHEAEMEVPFNTDFFWSNR